MPNQSTMIFLSKFYLWKFIIEKATQGPEVVTLVGGHGFIVGTAIRISSFSLAVRKRGCRWPQLTEPRAWQGRFHRESRRHCQAHGWRLGWGYDPVM